MECTKILGLRCLVKQEADVLRYLMTFHYGVYICHLFFIAPVLFNVESFPVCFLPSQSAKKKRIKKKKKKDDNYNTFVARNN